MDWLNAKRAALRGPQARPRGVMWIDGVPHDLPEPEALELDEDTTPARAANDGMTEWWRTDKPHLTVEETVPAREPQQKAQVQAVAPQQKPQVQEVTPPQEVVVPTRPPGGPVEKVTANAPKRTAVRTMGEKASGDRRLCILAFNGTAAGLGWALGLVDIISAYLPVAEQAAVGTFGFVLAAGGGWGAWKLSGADAVRAVFREKTILVRPMVTVGAAEIGRRLGPVPVEYLNAYGREWGLAPSSASLLITAAGIGGGLWWFIDRRIRHWPWACRWLFRVPLASALLACLPYSSGPVV
ncbi:hypothetical protein [Streptomyces eurythermus]